MSTSFTDWESGLYLAHHGIKGQKWGVRRYQNEDGTLTEEGLQRYGKRLQKYKNKLSEYSAKNDFYKNEVETQSRRLTKYADRDEHSGPAYNSAKKSLQQDLKNQEKAQKKVDKYQEKIDNLDNSANRLVRDQKALEEKEAGEEQAFNTFKKAMSSDDPSKFYREHLTDGTLDKTLSYVDRKASNTIDEWWKKKTTGSWRSEQTMESFDAEALQYAKKAAVELGMSPNNKETLYFLLSWFFTGDD